MIEDLKEEWRNSFNNPAHDQRLKDQVVLVDKLFEVLKRASN
jgi:hypothetical protein